MHGHHHHHGCSHGHDHEHGHHHHAPANYGSAFKIGILLNSGFIALEVFFGIAANSLALLADAGHNASDVLGLVLAWVAVKAAERAPNSRYTYGLQGASIMAAIANAVLLLIVTGGILWEAVQRFAQAETVTGLTVMAVAGAGILVNGATALLFMKGSKDDLNVRGAYLHMAADAAVSAGVVVAGGIVMLTGWLWVDPAISLVIGGVIIAGTWGLLRDSFNLALHGVPAHIQTGDVKAYLAGLPGVAHVHDLHIWAMSTNQVALSVHLLMPQGHPGDAFLREAAKQLEAQFKIHHSVIQIETSADAAACPLAPDHVV